MTVPRPSGWPAAQGCPTRQRRRRSAPCARQPSWPSLQPAPRLPGPPRRLLRECCSFWGAPRRPPPWLSLSASPRAPRHKTQPLPHPRPCLSRAFGKLGLPGKKVEAELGAHAPRLSEACRPLRRKEGRKLQCLVHLVSSLEVAQLHVPRGLRVAR